MDTFYYSDEFQAVSNKEITTGYPDMAVALVCDHKLAIPAGALAARITETWKVDVHIFVERPEAQRDPIIETRAPQVYYHYEELFDAGLVDLLPDHPRFSRASWGRLFVPAILGDYKRVLYCDIDILPGPLPEGIDRIVLPAGIGMVRDSYPLCPFVWKQPAHRQFPSLVTNVKKYFNSGVILFDPAVYSTENMVGALHDFMNDIGHKAVLPDQDFINLFFSERITELSPNLNFQEPLMGLGLIDEERVAIRHYCGHGKPYHELPRYGSSRSVQQATRKYAAMFEDADLPQFSVAPYKKISSFRQMKAAWRHIRSRIGIPSKKEKRLIADWRHRRTIAMNEIRALIANDRFADPNVFDFSHLDPIPVFYGTDVVARCHGPDTMGDIR